MTARRLALLGLLLAAGCRSHTVIDRQLEPAAPARSGDSVVVLGRGHGLGTPTDHDFVACVGRNLARDGRLQVIDEQAFLDAMYPWFETSTAPTSVAMLEPLFDNPAVAARLESLGVRYLIWIQGRTETVDKSGSIGCAVGPAGGGCFGFASWDDAADYEAALWQLDARAQVGRIGTHTEGTSYVPALILPVPLLARVRDAACDSMAEQIATHLAPR